STLQTGSCRQAAKVFQAGPVLLPLVGAELLPGSLALPGSPPLFVEGAEVLPDDFQGREGVASVPGGVLVPPGAFQDRDEAGLEGAHLDVAGDRPLLGVEEAEEGREVDDALAERAADQAVAVGRVVDPDVFQVRVELVRGDRA